MAAVEGSDNAQTRVGRIGRSELHVFSVDQRTGRNGRRQREARIGRAVTKHRIRAKLAIVAAGRDSREPRAVVSHGEVARTAVAGGRSDENASARGKQKRDFHRIEKTPQAAADREIDDVHAIRHSLIDGRHAVAVEAAPRVVPPAHLIRRDARAGRHSADCSQRDPVRARGDAVVPARRARCVRTVAVPVTHGEKLCRKRILHRGRAAKACVEPLRPDQLLIAHGGIELLARCTLSVPARDLLEHQLSAAVAVGKARVFRPDPAVHDSDNHAFTGVLDSAECFPDSAWRAQAQKLRGADRVRLQQFIVADGQNALQALQFRDSRGIQLRREPVESVFVAVEFSAAANGIQDRVVPRFEISRIPNDFRVLRIDFTSLSGLCRGVTRNIAFVGNNGRFNQPNDVNVRLAFCDVFIRTSWIGALCRRQRSGRDQTGNQEREKFCRMCRLRTQICLREYVR